MKSLKHLLARLKQKKLSFTTKQWIIIIAAVILGVCMSDLDDYLYRHNDAFRYVLLDKKVLIGDHHIEGARYGLKFALAAVIMNIIYRIEYEPQKRKLGTAMRRVRKYIGFIGLVFFTLILWLISWLDGLALQPDSNYVFYVYFILYILLRKEKRPYWVMTLSIFVIMGVFFLFFSNNFDNVPLFAAKDFIKEPYEYWNSYKIPRLWIGGYGLYCCGRVITWTSIFGGIVSIAILILMKVIRGIYQTMDSIKEVFVSFKKQEPEKLESKPRLDHSLERFVVAQERMYSRALEEVRNGRKMTHWIWYIFPQLKGLGHSNNSQYYGLDGVEEARAYLAHPILGARLREITAVVLEADKDVEEIFGVIDTIKLRSCMTLFAEIDETDLFTKVLEKHFEGEKDKKTLQLLSVTD